MFDFVQNNNLAIKIILGAVALTFVGFGVGSYSAAVEDPYLAKVGNAKIYQKDVERQLEGQPVNAASRQAVLENLIRQEMLLAEARGNRLAVSPQQLRAAIAAIPAFQENGKFSAARYTEFLQSRYLTPQAFEEQVSRDLLLQAQVAPYQYGSFVSQTLATRMAALVSEVREVRSVVLKPEQFAANVKLDDAMVKAFYDANLKRFKTADQARLEYVTLSQDAIAQGIAISDAEAQAYFDKNAGEFSNEERQVSHILLTADANAPAADKAKVKAQAEALLKEVRANPARFAELAKARSQDPGSAENGGDLGFFGRGVMTKPFESVAFAMKPGQISEVVETEFGYHILKLDAVKSSDFASQKAAVIDKLRKQKAAAAYRAAVEKLTDVAYQQGDSLKGVEAALNLKAQQTDFVPRSGKAGDPLLGNAKLLEAAFSDDVLKKKHNSEPVDVGNNTLVVVRVAEFQPARQRALSEVQAEIRTELAAREGAKLAAERGAAMLAELKAGKAPVLAWGEVKSLSRRDPAGTPLAELRAVFAANPKQTPGFAGVKRDNGEYVLYSIDKVLPAQNLSPQESAQLGMLLGDMSANSVMSAYLEQLRQKHQVVISQTQAEQ
ncbi:MAG: SurA N-terminal domain-containing protein [Vogesella sp.]|uniref:SurA N-terminal domain-containing protein n=1 Tax=Vogesella sp. TaxID=1904252 RepID=UPI00391DEFFA